MCGTQFGYDPTRERAYDQAPASTVTPPPAAQVDFSYLPPVGQQGTAAGPGWPPTCCAWASTELASFYAAKCGAVDPSVPGWQASPAQSYIQVMQNVSEPNGQCAGSCFTDYFDILTTSGSPSLTSAPYYQDCGALWGHYRMGPPLPDAGFIIPQPKMVGTKNITRMQVEINAGNPLVWGTKLYTDWNNYTGPNLPVPYVGNGVLSGEKHCMLIIAYNGTGFLIQNSQGISWGTTVDGQSGTDNCYGYVWMAYETFSALAEDLSFFIPD